jgi:catechol 2,3-dioxygenase-like lactoylglutathione lyase family enzyme
MKKLPLVRVAEVAFLTKKTEECARFYRKIGLEYPARPNKKHIHFADVGEQYFGFAHEDRGFMNGYGDEMVKVPLHVAFEVPFDQLDECIAFLEHKGIKCSSKIENSKGWHGSRRAWSTYFSDPAGNIMELWAPQR